MILLDTSGLLAWIDADQRAHDRTVAAMSAISGPFLISPFVLAEIDYLVATRVGAAAEQALLREVEREAFHLEPFDANDVGRAREILEKYSDLDLGLADASLVVLAERHRVTEILTLDERHFRVVTVAGGTPFRLLPSNAL